MNKAMNAVLENPFECLVFIVALSGAVLAVVSMFSDHKVRCYYPSVQQTEIGISYRVMGDVAWGRDIKTFVSGNPQETFSVLSTLKQCLETN